MASDSEASCISEPNFAVICGFLEKFGALCAITHPDFLDLQEMLENTQEVSPHLIDLHIKLLRRGKRSVSSDKWEKALIKFCHCYCSQDAWELERFGYKKARLSSKLNILKNLCEMQFDSNAKFKAEVNRLTSGELRSQPIGRDKFGHSYWYQIDDHCQLRVYREDPDEETWTLVARDREGLVRLIQQLTSGEVGEMVLNEDSNSLESEKPIIDTGQTSPSAKNCEIIGEESCNANDETKMNPIFEIKSDISQTAPKSDIKIQKNDSSNLKITISTKGTSHIKDDLNIEKTENQDEKLTETSFVHFTQQNKSADFSNKKKKSINELAANLRNKTTDLLERTSDADHEINLPTPRIRVKQFSSLSEPPILPICAIENEFQMTENEEDAEEDDEFFQSDLLELPIQLKQTRLLRPSLLSNAKKKSYSDEEQEYGEEIEEPLMLIQGEGSGKDCNNENFFKHEESEYGEAIEEPVMFFYGEGSGHNCTTGNTGKDDKNTDDANKSGDKQKDSSCLQSSQKEDLKLKSVHVEDKLKIEKCVDQVSASSKDAGDKKECTVISELSSAQSTESKTPKVGKIMFDIKSVERSTLPVKKLSRWDVGKPSKELNEKSGECTGKDSTKNSIKDAKPEKVDSTLDDNHISDDVIDKACVSEKPLVPKPASSVEIKPTFFFGPRSACIQFSSSVTNATTKSSSDKSSEAEKTSSNSENVPTIVTKADISLKNDPSVSLKEEKNLPVFKKPDSAVSDHSVLKSETKCESKHLLISHSDSKPKNHKNDQLSKNINVSTPSPNKELCDGVGEITECKKVGAEVDKAVIETSKGNPSNKKSETDTTDKTVDITTRSKDDLTQEVSDFLQKTSKTDNTDTVKKTKDSKQDGKAETLLETLESLSTLLENESHDSSNVKEEKMIKVKLQKDNVAEKNKELKNEATDTTKDLSKVQTHSSEILSSKIETKIDEIKTKFSVQISESSTVKHDVPSVTAELKSECDSKKSSFQLNAATVDDKIAKPTMLSKAENITERKSEDNKSKSERSQMKSNKNITDMSTKPKDILQISNKDSKEVTCSKKISTSTITAEKQANLLATEGSKDKQISGVVSLPKTHDAQSSKNQETTACSKDVPSINPKIASPKESIAPKNDPVVKKSDNTSDAMQISRKTELSKPISATKSGNKSTELEKDILKEPPIADCKIGTKIITGRSLENRQSVEISKIGETKHEKSVLELQKPLLKETCDKEGPSSQKEIVIEKEQKKALSSESLKIEHLVPKEKLNENLIDCTKKAQIKSPVEKSQNYSVIPRKEKSVGAVEQTKNLKEIAKLHEKPRENLTATLQITKQEISKSAENLDLTSSSQSNKDDAKTSILHAQKDDNVDKPSASASKLEQNLDIAIKPIVKKEENVQTTEFIAKQKEIIDKSPLISKLKEDFDKKLELVSQPKENIKILSEVTKDVMLDKTSAKNIDKTLTVKQEKVVVETPPVASKLEEKLDTATGLLPKLKETLKNPPAVAKTDEKHDTTPATISKLEEKPSIVKKDLMEASTLFGKSKENLKTISVAKQDENSDKALVMISKQEEKPKENLKTIIPVAKQVENPDKPLISKQKETLPQTASSITKLEEIVDKTSTNIAEQVKSPKTPTVVEKSLDKPSASELQHNIDTSTLGVKREQTISSVVLQVKTPVTLVPVGKKDENIAKPSPSVSKSADNLNKTSTIVSKLEKNTDKAPPTVPKLEDNKTLKLAKKSEENLKTLEKAAKQEDSVTKTGKPVKSLEVLESEKKEISLNPVAKQEKTITSVFVSKHDKNHDSTSVLISSAKDSLPQTVTSSSKVQDILHTSSKTFTTQQVVKEQIKNIAADAKETKPDLKCTLTEKDALAKSISKKDDNLPQISTSTSKTVEKNQEENTKMPAVVQKSLDQTSKVQDIVDTPSKMITSQKEVKEEQIKNIAKETKPDLKCTLAEKDVTSKSISKKEENLPHTLTFTTKLNKIIDTTSKSAEKKQEENPKTPTVVGKTLDQTSKAQDIVDTVSKTITSQKEVKEEKIKNVAAVPKETKSDLKCTPTEKDAIAISKKEENLPQTSTSTAKLNKNFESTSKTTEKKQEENLNTPTVVEKSLAQTSTLKHYEIVSKTLGLKQQENKISSLSVVKQGENDAKTSTSVLKPEEAHSKSLNLLDKDGEILKTSPSVVEREENIDKSLKSSIVKQEDKMTKEVSKLDKASTSIETLKEQQKTSDKSSTTISKVVKEQENTNKIDASERTKDSEKILVAKVVEPTKEIAKSKMQIERLDTSTPEDKHISPKKGISEQVKLNTDLRSKKPISIADLSKAVKKDVIETSKLEFNKSLGTVDTSLPTKSVDTEKKQPEQNIIVTKSLDPENLQAKEEHTKKIESNPNISTILDKKIGQSVKDIPTKILAHENLDVNNKDKSIMKEEVIKPSVCKTPASNKKEIKESVNKAIQENTDDNKDKSKLSEKSSIKKLEEPISLCLEKSKKGDVIKDFHGKQFAKISISDDEEKASSPIEKDNLLKQVSVKVDERTTKVGETDIKNVLTISKQAGPSKAPAALVKDDVKIESLEKESKRFDLEINTAATEKISSTTISAKDKIIESSNEPIVKDLKKITSILEDVRVKEAVILHNETKIHSIDKSKLDENELKLEETDIKIVYKECKKIGTSPDIEKEKDKSVKPISKQAENVKTDESSNISVSKTDTPAKKIIVYDIEKEKEKLAKTISKQEENVKTDESSNISLSKIKASSKNIIVYDIEKEKADSVKPISKQAENVKIDESSNMRVFRTGEAISLSKIVDADKIKTTELSKSNVSGFKTIDESISIAKKEGVTKKSEPTKTNISEAISISKITDVDKTKTIENAKIAETSKSNISAFKKTMDESVSITKKEPSKSNIIEAVSISKIVDISKVTEKAKIDESSKPNISAFKSINESVSITKKEGIPKKSEPSKSNINEVASISKIVDISKVTEKAKTSELSKSNVGVFKNIDESVSITKKEALTKNPETSKSNVSVSKPIRETIDVDKNKITENISSQITISKIVKSPIKSQTSSDLMIGQVQIKKVSEQLTKTLPTNEITLKPIEKSPCKVTDATDACDLMIGEVKIKKVTSPTIEKSVAPVIKVSGNLIGEVQIKKVPTDSKSKLKEKDAVKDTPDFDDSSDDMLDSCDFGGDSYMGLSDKSDNDDKEEVIIPPVEMSKKVEITQKPKRGRPRKYAAPVGELPKLKIKSVADLNKSSDVKNVEKDKKPDSKVICVDISKLQDTSPKPTNKKISALKQLTPSSPQSVLSIGDDSNDVLDVPETDPLACSEDEVPQIPPAPKGLSLATFKMDDTEPDTSLLPEPLARALRNRKIIASAPLPKIRKRVKSTEVKVEDKTASNKNSRLTRRSLPVEKEPDVSSSDDEKSVATSKVMKTTPKRGGARGRRGRGRGGWTPQSTRVSNASPAPSVSSDDPSEASKPEVTPEKKTKIKKKRRVLGLDIDPSTIIVPAEKDDSETVMTRTSVRQSRRIAQIKIKEQAERRNIEDIIQIAETQESGKKKKKKKSHDKDYKTDKKKLKKHKVSSEEEEEADESETEAPDSKKKHKKKNKIQDLKKLFNVSHPWQSSSESDEEEEHEEEEFEEEPSDVEVEHVLKSDHEFSPESDLEGAEIQPLRRARTVKKESDTEEPSDEHACQKCSKSDHPEWILLCDKCDCGWHCSCLRPALLVIPEGDWFCPPCQHIALIEALQIQLGEYDKKSNRMDLEERRKERLAYVGISLANVLSTKEHGEKDEDERQKQSASSSSSASESSSSSSSAEDDEPIYQLRQRRQAHSYRFNDYDDLINSAIQDELEAVKGAGNQGRGKDIATIVNAEKEEAKAQALLENQDEVPPVVPTSEETPKPKEVSDADSEDELRVVPKHAGRKKHRKLNALDVSSEDDDNDEDFKGTSEEEEEDIDDVPSDDSDDMDVGRRGKRGGPIRRSTRAKTQRYDKEFINDDTDDEKLRIKKRKSIWDESESEESDKDWGQKKRSKKQRQLPIFRSGKKSKKKRKRDYDSDPDAPRQPKAKRPRIQFGGLDDSDEDETLGRRTRGKKMNYLDLQDTDSEEEKKPTRKIVDSEDEYVANEDEDEEQEEAVEEEKDSESESDNERPPVMPRTVLMLPPKGRGKAGIRRHAKPSEPPIPPIVIQKANILPEKEETVEEPSVDKMKEIPIITANPDNLDEEEVETMMMESEEYANKQLELMAIQLAKEKKKKEMEMAEKSDDEQVPSMNVQGPSTIVQGPPTDVQIPQSNVQVPQINVQLPLSNAEMSPLNIQMPPSNMQMPSCNMQMSPSNLQMPPSNIMMSSNMQMSSSNVQMAPSNIQFPLSNVQMSPSDVHMSQLSPNSAQFPPNSAQFPPNSGQFAPRNIHFPPSNIPPSNIQMIPSNIQMIPSNMQIPPSNRHMPPSNMQMSQPNMQMPPSNVQFPPLNVQLPLPNTQFSPTSGPLPSPSSNAQLPQTTPPLEKTPKKRGRKRKVDIEAAAALAAAAAGLEGEVKTVPPITISKAKLNKNRTPQLQDEMKGELSEEGLSNVPTVVSDLQTAAPPKRRGRGKGKKALEKEKAAAVAAAIAAGLPVPEDPLPSAPVSDPSKSIQVSGTVVPPTSLTNTMISKQSDLEIDPNLPGKLGIAAPPQPFSQSQPTPSVITRMLQSQPISAAQNFTQAANNMAQKYFPNIHDQPPRGVPPGQFSPMANRGGRGPSPYRQTPPTMNMFPGMRPGPTGSPHRLRSPGPPMQQMFHNTHHALDPSPSGGGPISITAVNRDRNSPGMPPTSNSPLAQKDGPPPQLPPPYNRGGININRFPLNENSPGPSLPPHAIQERQIRQHLFVQSTAAHLQQPSPPPRQPPPGGNFSPYHPPPPNYHYGAYPPAPPLGGADDALPPTDYQGSPYPEHYNTADGPVNSSEGSNSKPFDEEGSGEFGGLVSYFSSQREDDLDT